MKIRHKLILGFVSIALLIAVVGYISVSKSRKVLQESIGGESTAFAAKMLEHLDRCIYSRIETFQEYSRDLITQRVISESNKEFEKLDNIQAYISEKDREWTSAPEEEVTAFMQKLINNDLSKELREKIKFYEGKYGYRVFGEVFITNKYGANAAQTGKTTDYYQADEQWWQMAKKDGLYVADVEYDRSANVYSTDICLRMDDEAGDLLGVMKIVLNIEETVVFIRKAEKAAEAGHKTVQFKLLTRDGRIIYATDEFEFLQNLPMELSSVLRHGEHEPGHTSYFIAAGDKPGEGEELFAHVHSQGYKDFKGLGWILVVEYETEEIFAPIVKLRSSLLTAALGITILAVFLGLVISKAISNPVGKLAGVAAEIGKGNLDTPIEVESSDEFGLLAASFKKMTEDLKETTTSIGKLNKEITERKRAEEALRLHSEIMKNMAEGVYLVRASDGIIVYANPKSGELFGYAPSEMLGKHVSIVNFPTGNSPQETAAEIMGIMERTGEWQGEICNIKKDGTPFWCYASVTTFDHPEYGRVLVAVHADITDRKRAEEKQARQLAEIERMNRLMTGREERVIEMKKEVNALLAELGRQSRYTSVLEGERQPAPGYDRPDA